MSNQNQPGYEENDAAGGASRPAFITSKNIQAIALDNPDNQQELEQPLNPELGGVPQGEAMSTLPDAEEIGNDNEHLRDDLDEQESEVVETQLMAAEELTQKIVGK